VIAITGAVVAGPTAPAAHAQEAPQYVALGDSYTSGPFILPPALGAPLDCVQSARNYPHLVAQTLGLTLHDVSCGGAQVSNMTQSQYLDQPPQFDALRSSTTVVTLGIGGNDDNTFITAVAGCGAIDITDAQDDGAPCKSIFGSRFADNIASDGKNIATALRQIHTLSPNAKVYVVGYPDILPHQGNCWPQVPLTTGDVAYLDGVEHDLNSMLETQAEANAATFVDTYTPSVGHDACKAEGVRWVEPVVPQTDAFSVHPNAAGENAMAGQVEAATGE
jgi:lysophospholipase L1-like esterase